MALQAKVREHQDAAAKLDAATEVRTLATWRLDVRFALRVLVFFACQLPQRLEYA